MGDGAGSQPGVQVLPAHGTRQKTACDRRVAMEADGGSCGTRDVACRSGELRCDGGRIGKELRNGMLTLSGSFFPIWNWKRKSGGNVGCRQKKRVMRPPAHSAHLRGSGKKPPGRGG